MLPRFANQTVVILTPVLLEERGEIVEDWSLPIRVSVEKCSVQPGDGAADNEHANALIADYTVYLPPETVLPEKFRVELPTTAGQFILTGEPQPWIFGMRVDHLRIRLKRRAG